MLLSLIVRLAGATGHIANERKEASHEGKAQQPQDRRPPEAEADHHLVSRTCRRAGKIDQMLRAGELRPEDIHTCVYWAKWMRRSARTNGIWRNSI